MSQSLVRLAGGLCVLAAVHAQALIAQAHPSRRSVQRVQSAPPAEGSISWGRDNCSYKFSNGSWHSLDLCRVMRSRAVYDTYKASTREWQTRIDESQPGWIATLMLNAPNQNWIKFATNGSGRTLVLIDNRWQDFNALAAAERARQVATQPRRLSCSTPRAGEPMIARNVRENTPTNPDCWTPEERRYINNSNLQVIGGTATTAQRLACEQRRSGTPYVDGKISDGWYETAAGPRLRSC